METKYYNRSNNFSAPIRKEPKPYVPLVQKESEDESKEILCQKESKKEEEIKELKKLKNDDILLLGIIILLLSDSKSDKLLLLALGYLFISSYIKP